MHEHGRKSSTGTARLHSHSRTSANSPSLRANRCRSLWHHQHSRTHLHPLAPPGRMPMMGRHGSRHATGNAYVTWPTARARGGDSTPSTSTRHRENAGAHRHLDSRLYTIVTPSMCRNTVSVNIHSITTKWVLGVPHEATNSYRSTGNSIELVPCLDYDLLVAWDVLTLAPKRIFSNDATRGALRC